MNVLNTSIVGKFCVFILLISALTGFASATYIQLSTQITVENMVNDSSTEINVSIINHGDESASDVQLSLSSPQGFQTSDSIPLGILKPNVTYGGTFRVNIDDKTTPGRYVFVLITRYADMNGYPFSGVAPVSLVYKKDAPKLVHATISNLELPEKDTQKLTLSIRNLDNSDHTVNVKLFLPGELKSDEAEKEVYVKSKEEKQMEFPVSTFGALPGSSYPVLAAISFEDSQLHYSSMAASTIRIVKQKSIFTLPSNQTLIAIVVVLILILVYYQFKKK